MIIGLHANGTAQHINAQGNTLPNPPVHNDISHLIARTFAQEDLANLPLLERMKQKRRATDKTTSG